MMNSKIKLFAIMLLSMFTGLMAKKAPNLQKITFKNNYGSMVDIRLTWKCRKTGATSISNPSLENGKKGEYKATSTGYDLHSISVISSATVGVIVATSLVVGCAGDEVVAPFVVVAGSVASGICTEGNYTQKQTINTFFDLTSASGEMSPVYIWSYQNEADYNACQNIQKLTQAQVVALTQSQIAAYSANEIAHFTPIQQSYFTQAQIAYLSPSQKEKFKPATFATFKNNLTVPVNVAVKIKNKNTANIKIAAGAIYPLLPCVASSPTLFTVTGTAPYTTAATSRYNSLNPNYTISGLNNSIVLSSSATPLTPAPAPTVESAIQAKAASVTFTNNLSVAVTVTASTSGKAYQTITIPAANSAPITCIAKTPITLTVVGVAPYTTAAATTYSLSVPTYTISAGANNTILLNNAAGAVTTSATAKTKLAALKANKK